MEGRERPGTGFVIVDSGFVKCCTRFSPFGVVEICLFNEEEAYVRGDVKHNTRQTEFQRALLGSGREAKHVRHREGEGEKRETPMFVSPNCAANAAKKQTRLALVLRLIASLLLLCRNKLLLAVSICILYGTTPLSISISLSSPSPVLHPPPHLRPRSIIRHHKAHAPRSLQ